MKKNFTINLSSSSKKSITIYLKFLTFLFQKVQIQSTIVHLPCKSRDIALLKSPHVNKKAKEHFGIKNYKTMVCFNTVPDKHLLKYLVMNKPKSVFVRYIFTDYVNKNENHSDSDFNIDKKLSRKQTHQILRFK